MRALLLVALVGCGGMSAQDKKDVVDAVHADTTLARMCADDDAGSTTCMPKQVRAMTRSSTCNLSSLLYRNGIDVLDGGGPQCPP